MRTLIVSDLHLGSNSGIDILRRPELQSGLFDALEGVDRLVLLGDVLELRHGPLREAMNAARPFFENLGAALGERRLVLTAGNHDHALLEPWLAARGAEVDPGPLQPEQLLEPAEASQAMARIAAWAAPAQVSVAYPGLWVRPDVYAMHGHYLDCHLTVPTLERLTVGVMSRVLGLPAEEFSGAEDYEAMGAPVFAWRDVVARHTHPGSALNGMAMVTVWKALNGGSRRDSGAGTPGSIRERLSGEVVPSLRRRALVGAFPLAVGALNMLGLGPLRSEISASELRRAGLAAMGEVAIRLGLEDAYVVFGHTHRAGPLPRDRPEEWVGRGGARLVNSGSWTYAGIFLDRSGPENPYWPGSAVLVEEQGPPRVLRLLQDRTRAELRPARRAERSAAAER